MAQRNKRDGRWLVIAIIAIVISLGTIGAMAIFVNVKPPSSPDHLLAVAGNTNI